MRACEAQNCGATSDKESEVNEERKTSRKIKRPIWKSILKWIGIAVVAVIVATVLFFCVVRGITWFSYRIDTANGIDEMAHLLEKGRQSPILILKR